MTTTSKLNAISLLAEAKKCDNIDIMKSWYWSFYFLPTWPPVEIFNSFLSPQKFRAPCVHLNHRRQLYFGTDWLLIYQLHQQSTVTNFEDFFAYKISYFLCTLTRTIKTVLHNRCEEANHTSGRASPWGDSRYRVPCWVSVGPHGRSHWGKRYPLEDNCNPEANSNK